VGSLLVIMANYDEKTGIHYGVISPNSICQETLSDLCDKSIDTIYEESKKTFLSDLESFCDDHYLDFKNINEDSFIDEFNQNYDNDNHGYEYEDKDYFLQISDDNFGIFVIKSPYYTYTKQCSPCAPGAGDLNNPVEKEKYVKKGYPSFNNLDMYSYVKSYCLPKEFFDDEYSKIPYRYYRVDNDKEEITPIIEVK